MARSFRNLPIALINNLSYAFWFKELSTAYGDLFRSYITEFEWFDIRNYIVVGFIPVVFVLLPALVPFYRNNAVKGVAANGKIILYNNNNIEYMRIWTALTG